MKRVSATEPQASVDRGRAKLLVLLIATLLAVYLCWQVVVPFVPAVVLAITLAIITHRPIRWLRRRWSHSTVAAAGGVLVVALTFLVPVGALTAFAVREISNTVSRWQTEEAQSKLRESIEQSPQLQPLWEKVSRDVNLEESLPRLFERLQESVTAIIQGAVYTVTQGLFALFFLFFLYRDERTALSALRGVLPLDDQETDEIFRRVNDTVHATMFGTVLVAMVQGVLGGAMFAVLGVPGAVLWGVTMGILSIIPYLGSFVIWGPVATMLAVQGHWTKACILTGWGLIAIGLVDNLLYPMLVGQRLKQHPAIAFVAILGGVAAFGISGIVIGPVLVTVTIQLLEVWRQRTLQHSVAEEV